jgi:hypothetical protein
MEHREIRPQRRALQYRAWASAIAGKARLAPNSPESASLSALRGAKSAHQEDDQTHQQDKAHATATDGRATKVEAAATEEEEKHNQEEY